MTRKPGEPPPIPDTESKPSELPFEGLSYRKIREGDLGPKCSKCGSSMQRRLWFWRTGKCIHPKCENYYGK